MGLVSARDVPDRFAVAFSLAGEQRELVLQVAQEVESVLGRSTVFYDEWFEHWIAGRDADLLLQKIYGERADLVVMCVSGHYGDKPWPAAEHRAIRARFMQADSDVDRPRVLPVRVGDGEVEGVLFNDLVPDLRDRTVAGAAELIIARLNVAKGQGAVASGVQWPHQAPELQWPLADHTEPRSDFAKLLSGSSSSRALLVRGPSETGKSCMSKQMWRSATALPGVVCGRFDFKGTSSMDVEVEAFSQPLDIEPPEGQTLNERLTKIFTELRRRQRPTVLVFDTYEEASQDGKDWLQRVLLQHLTRAAWLRVVIMGQSVPVRAGADWESIAAPPITVQPPGPEDWLEYGREHHGDVDLEFVTRAHSYSGGRATALASLLGPAS